jgi:hypothetical protein
VRKALYGTLNAIAGVLGAGLRLAGQALPGVAGAGLIAYGAWLAWQPAGFIVAGLLLLADRAWEQARADRRRR